MPDKPVPPSFTFHIEGGVQDENAVPAAVLVQILENAQRAIELIGLHVEGREIKERARVPAATSKRFQLVCRLPQPGCYAIPVTVGDTVGDLYLPEMIERAFGVFRQIMEGVSARDPGKISGALPDQRIRRRVLEAVKGMAPRADAKWRLDLLGEGDASFAEFDAETIPFVQETLVPAEQREAARTVTGELKSIDFAARKLTIIYPPTSREMDCYYEEALEDLLYENRRDLIQVTGRVLLDEKSIPKQIIDVTDIRDLDVSPLVIDSFSYGGLSLKALVKLVLEITTDESKQLLSVQAANLGIDSFAQTREALLSDLYQQIAMLWQEYALASDDILDAEARKLKQALLIAFSEVKDAA